METIAMFESSEVPLVALCLRVQVPNNHILTQNQYYNYYYPKPKYLIIGYMHPLGLAIGYTEYFSSRDS